MKLIRIMGAATLCMALLPALARADAADRLGSPMHEIFAQEVQPSVGGMQDPGSVTPQSLNGMTIHLKMTKASAMAMHHEMKMHPGMNCKIEPFEPGATFTMVLVCR